MAAAVTAPEADSHMTRLAAEIATAMERMSSDSSADLDLAPLDTPSEADLHQGHAVSSSAASYTNPLPADTTTSPEYFVTPTSQSPEQAFKKLDGAPLTYGESRNESPEQKQKGGIVPLAGSMMPKAMRRRSSSGAGGVLARLTSRSSATGSIYSSSSDTTTSKPKLDKKSLSRQENKYKSGVNWNNSDVTGNVEEPFEVSSSPVDERNFGDLRENDEELALRELASAGGTKAALAQARYNTIGMPYFPSAQRAMLDAQESAAAAAAAAENGSRTPQARLPVDASSRSPTATSPSLQQGELDVEAAPVAGDEDTPQSPKFTPEEAQRVLQSARDAVALSNAALKVPNANEQLLSPPQPSQERSLDVPEDASIAKRKPRRSFMGFGMGIKDMVSGKKDAQKDKKAAEGDDDAATGVGDEVLNTPDNNSGSTTPGASAPADNMSGGTVGRRRRFNDTRELNLVASQLAAEALMPPTHSPAASSSSIGHDRRASMMSVLASVPNGNVSPPSGYANGGQSVWLPGVNGLAAPQPAFAGSSPAGGSPRNGSPRVGGFGELPRAQYARSNHSSNSQTGSPSITQSAKINGLPCDMLTGLSDGPYPFLPPRAYDLSDPFTPPTNSLEFDVAASGSGSRQGSVTSTGRNSLPYAGSSTQSRARGMSSGSAQTWNSLGVSGSQTPPARRSVLQMTMHNPEQEMQGLTKVPKSGKSTPFGSRAPSRQVTPNASVTNLREAAKEEADKAAKAKSKSSKTERAGLNVSEGGDSKGTAPKSKRMSMFLKKTKSSTDLDSVMGIRAASTDSPLPSQQLKPPVPGTGTDLYLVPGSSQYRNSASNDSTTSRPASSSPTSEERVGRNNDDTSAQSLVKVPSPSMTTESGSSHDRSGLGTSDGGNSMTNAMSAVTTPDVPITKMDLMPSPSLPDPTVSALAGPSEVPDVSTTPTPPQAVAVPNGMPSPSTNSTLVNSQMAQTFDALPTRTAASPPRPARSPARSTSYGRAEAAVQSRVGKLMSRFAARGATTNNGSSSTLTAKPAPRSTANMRGLLASKSQGHLPSTLKQQQAVPPRMPVLEKSAINSYDETVVEPRQPKTINGRFGQFRNTLQRDWFV